MSTPYYGLREPITRIEVKLKQAQTTIIYPMIGDEPIASITARDVNLPIILSMFADDDYQVCVAIGDPGGHVHLAVGSVPDELQVIGGGELTTIGELRKRYPA